MKLTAKMIEQTCSLTSNRIIVLDVLSKQGESQFHFIALKRRDGEGFGQTKKDLDVVLRHCEADWIGSDSTEQFHRTK
jgi:hypothetical protein